MLKVNKDIELTELTKYGFKYLEGTSSKLYVVDIDEIDSYSRIIVNCFNKTVWVNHEGYDKDLPDKLLDTLFDLIKDGIVEKVEG